MGVDTDKDTLNKAIKLINIGSTHKGGVLLNQFLKKHPSNEEAWVLLHYCVDSSEDAIYCLKMALKINPHNRNARKSLTELTRQKIIEENSGTKSFLQTTERKTSLNLETLGKKKKKAKSNQKKKKGKSRIAGESRNIKIPFLPPKVIINKPEENFFDERNWVTNIQDKQDSGILGNRLYINGICIHPTDLPSCINNDDVQDEYSCDLCEFISSSECRLRSEPYLLEDVRVFLVKQRIFSRKQLERRRALIRAIYKELKGHGRPLHYAVITRIVAARYPFFTVTEKIVLTIMARRPNKFEKIFQGVYKAV